MVIGPPGKRKQDNFFGNPQENEGYPKPEWKRHPILDNYQYQNQHHRSRNGEQSVSDVYPRRYFFQFRPHQAVTRINVSSIPVPQKLRSRPTSACRHGAGKGCQCCGWLPARSVLLPTAGQIVMIYSISCRSSLGVWLQIITYLHKRIWCGDQQGVVDFLPVQIFV